MTERLDVLADGVLIIPFGVEMVSIASVDVGQARGVNALGLGEVEGEKEERFRVEVGEFRFERGFVESPELRIEWSKVEDQLLYTFFEKAFERAESRLPSHRWPTRRCIPKN
jgi:hypothetical protein